MAGPEPETPAGKGGRIPLSLKIPYTLFVLFLVPVYWRVHGPATFLWVSDVALILTCVALWLQSPLLASMMALAALVPDTLWIIDFSLRLAAGPGSAGGSGTAYMFDPRMPLWVRLLSLFHVPLPAILFWLVRRLGYDRRALPFQTLLLWLLLTVSYLFVPAEKNVNLVHGFGSRGQEWLPAPLYLLVLMFAYPLVVYVPTHFLLVMLTPRRTGDGMVHLSKGR